MDFQTFSDGQVRPTDNPALVSSGTASAAPTSPWRILAETVGWCLLAFLAAFVASFFLGFVFGFTGLSKTLPKETIAALSRGVAAIGAGGAMLWIAIAHAKTGDENVLGNVPVQRRGLVALTAALSAIYIVTLLALALNIRPEVRAILSGRQGWSDVPLILAGLLAPFAEELFLRGWVWNRLSSSWNAVSVAIATSTIWLLMHAPDGFGRVTLLLPVAVALPLVRHKSKSVWGSVIVHLAYNVSALLTTFGARYLNF